MLLSQMENCFCKIFNDDGRKGTGFFCRFPFPDENNLLLNVLITNNNILNENNLDNDKIIKFKIYNKKKGRWKKIKIKIDNSIKKLTIYIEEEGIDIIYYRDKT